MGPRKDGTLSRKGDTLSRNKEGTLSRNKEGTLSRNKEGTLSRQNKGDTLSRQGKGEGTLGRKGILKTANNAAAAPTANPGLSFFFPCLLFVHRRHWEIWLRGESWPPRIERLQ